MKSNNKIKLIVLIIVTVLFSYSCDPFDDLYLTLSMDTEFNVDQGFGSEIGIEEIICLSDFEDYEDNRENIDEIIYIASTYMTISSSTGLNGDNLRLTLTDANRSDTLFQYFQADFNAEYYIDKPLEITLTEQEKNNINNYLKNPQVNKCFYAKFELENVRYNSPAQFYFLHSKMEFLTRLKIKP